MIEYIFSINAGRSGSNYLEKLFSCIENTSAYHEPAPVMNRKLLINYLMGDSSLLLEKIEKKVEAIKNLKGRSELYVETNHVFIKSFGWLIPNYIEEEKIGIVILKRDKESIAKSFARIGCNAFNNDGKGWLIHVNKKNKIVPLPPDIRFPLIIYYWMRIRFRIFYFIKRRIIILNGILNTNYKINEPKVPGRINQSFLEWYVDELFKMGEEYQRKYPNISYYTVGINELNTFDGVQKMFDFFNLQCINQPKLMSIIGEKINQKEMLS